MTLLEWSGWGVAGALALLALIQALNLRRFTPPTRRSGRDAPRISACVPARDEERSIEACVRSLAAQGAVEEVLVLDDDSSDQTAGIVARIAAENPKVRLLRGAPLPPGWRGKNWACHQLALAARNEWILFTDADTVHEPESAAAAGRHAEAEGLDLYSLLPNQVQGSLIERLALPLMTFSFVTFFPAFLLTRTRHPKIAAANGQYLLFRRRAYEAIGGHASIRDSVVDDLAIAKRIREKGLTLAVGDGQALVSCRMYHSGLEVIDGFTKNLFAAIGGSAPAALAVGLALIALFPLPPIVALATAEPAWIAATLLAFALRMRLARRRDDSVTSSLAHPLAMALATAVLFRSMLRTTLGLGIQWKGREVAG